MYTSHKDFILHHQSFSGIHATFVALQGRLVFWLREQNPDIVSMIVGTNDMLWTEDPISKILDAYTTLVQQMRESNPKMKIIVAQILPTTRGKDEEERIEELNAAIPAWARSMNMTAKGSPVRVVDLWTGFDTKRFLFDNVHPNVAGDRFIAERMAPALKEAMEAVARDRGVGLTWQPKIWKK